MPAKSKLGQNFLRDAVAIERIVAALGDCSARTVLEIGPGKGAITELLATRAKQVIAVEVDTALAEHLRSALPAERVSVVFEDILSYDLEAAAIQAGEKLLVVGNLPYYITSPILLKLAANHSFIERSVLMVQREVADRVAASPGSRDYGVLSVTAQMYGPVTPLFTLPPSAFSPPPEVHSNVFRWHFAPRFAELHVEEVSFIALVKRVFAQKRKTLANNLRAAGYEPAAIAVALKQTGVESTARAEALSLKQLAALWRELPQK
ncbi:MAG: ribosomal RNA small subunit methyltransferase A [Acidobacteriota bacterium]|nr:ribosomal RNA small subunit methyltransferase A [Acidobacteriota bacterium]